MLLCVVVVCAFVGVFVCVFVCVCVLACLLVGLLVGWLIGWPVDLRGSLPDLNAVQQPPAAKRRRLARDVVIELVQAKELLNAQCLNPSEFEQLKARLLIGE